MTLEEILTKDSPIFRTIANLEGFRSKRYTDATGHPTIGYGHLLPETSILKEVTLAQAQQMLLTDIEICVYDLQNFFRDNGISAYWYSNLSVYQVTALISFIFNLGITKFKGYGISALVLVYIGSKVKGIELADVRCHIHDKMLQFVYSNKMKLDGLVHRRSLEASFWMK